MKKLLLAIMMLATPVAAQDEQVDGYTVNVPINCTPDGQQMIDLIKQRFGEDIVFLGQSKTPDEKELYTSLWVNPTTQTWSFIVINKELGHGCIVGSGDPYQLFMLPTI